jgi:hypothetical protein
MDIGWCFYAFPGSIQPVLAGNSVQLDGKVHLARAPHVVIVIAHGNLLSCDVDSRLFLFAQCVLDQRVASKKE